MKNSRNYQNEKEALYLQALSLTLVRFQFTPIYSVDGSANYAETSIEVENGVNTIIRERTVRGGAGVRADYLLRTGGRIAVDLSTDFLRFVSGDPGLVTSSALVATFTQPLLRGSGKAAAEPLTQSERNMMYALRDFVRFRQGFTFEIVSRYYGVLQNRDSVANSYRSLVSLRENVERETEFVAVDRRPKAQLDELKQNELSVETRWINDVRQYQQNLDNFKIDLGLPVETHIMLDPRELEAMEIIDTDVTEADAVEIALNTRLDLYNQRDQFQDSIRHVDVAANGLLPQVDLVGSASAGTVEGGGGFPNIDWERYRWDAGLNVNLPIDRRAERNAYRTALINQDRSARNLELAIDNVRLQIRDDWRALDQAKRTFEINELGVEIARRRVEEQTLRLDLGQGLARDLVDAETSFLVSQDTLTAARVGHTLARLRFFLDMGLLTINDDGTWNASIELSSN